MESKAGSRLLFYREAETASRFSGEAIAPQECVYRGFERLLGFLLFEFHSFGLNALLGHALFSREVQRLRHLRFQGSLLGANLGIRRRGHVCGEPRRDRGRLFLAEDRQGLLFGIPRLPHSLLLGLTPRAAPFDLARHDPAAIERDGMVTHPGGLRLLNNLTGSGDAGQITSADAIALLNGLLPQGDCVVLSLPLYPVELLRDVAARSNLIAVVAPIDPAGLAATRSALGVIDHLGVGSSHVGLILIGDAAMPIPDLEREVLATLTPSADSSDPSYAALVARLRTHSERLVA